MDRTTEEILRDLQAQVYVMRTGLRALMQTHPDPAQLLDALHGMLCDSTAESMIAVAAPELEEAETLRNLLEYALR